MLIWIVFAVMTAALVLALLWPLLGQSLSERDALTSADVYREQLAELEREHEAGRIGGPEYQAARAEIGRRLIKASQRAEAGAADAPSRRQRPIWIAAAVAVGVPLLGLAIYLALGSPNMPDQPLAARGPEVDRAREFMRLTEQLEAKLKAGQGDATGWMMLGRAKGELGDYGASAEAYGRAIAMLKAKAADVPADVYIAQGEALVGANKGQITTAARDAFKAALAIDPKQPSARYYLALAKLNEGDKIGALADFKALLADAPKDAPYRPLIEERIRALEPPPPK